VSEFVEECRREWRRLGVQDAVANEMAADLTADLEEAEAEGGSPEDVLGNSAFDPRPFAAAWAVARGVTGSPIRGRPPIWRSQVAIALTAILAMFTVGAGLLLLVGDRGRSIAFAVRGVVTGSGSIRFPGRGVGPGPLGAFFGPQPAGAAVNALALLLFMVGIAALGLAVALYWSPWSGRRRARRTADRGTPGWN
jgi:hypothetical protein